MGQSLNLYMSEPSGRKLHDMYFLAWSKGLKTTYYLRTLAATQIEKSTVDVNRYGVQPRWMKSKSASGDIAVDRSADDEQRHDGPEEPVGQPHAIPATDMSSVQACSLDDPDCEACQ
jgi:ribonucleoside-diphosphate reductase alpha chain